MTKWPASLTLIRHAQSSYNVLRGQRNGTELYQRFLAAYEQDYASQACRELALEVKRQFALPHGDWDTPATEEGLAQARAMGSRLKDISERPDVVFVSPYLRTHQTFEQMCLGWPELSEAKVVTEERIREQEHGLALTANDWRVFFALYPEQKELHDLQGDYWYQWPQGECVPNVRERCSLWISTLVREYSGQKVFAITHHLSILAIMANLERWNATSFMEKDDTDKPINCGVTTYLADPTAGSSGKLVLQSYNQKHY